MLDNTYNQGTEGDAGYGLQPALIGTYDYGNSTLDGRNRIAATANHAIPFKATSHLADEMLGGWQVNALRSLEAGKTARSRFAPTVGPKDLMEVSGSRWNTRHKKRIA